MKRSILLFALFFLIPFKGLILIAQNNSSSDSVQEINLTNKKPPIHSGDIKRSLERKIVYAYISNDFLTVNFTSTTPNATITISNKLTGEIEYTEVCNAESTTIDLSTFVEENNNTYTINISTSSWERSGIFTY